MRASLPAVLPYGTCARPRGGSLARVRTDLSRSDVAFVLGGGLFTALLLVSLAQSGQVVEALVLAVGIAAYGLVELARLLHRRRQVAALGGAELRPVHLVESRALPLAAADVWTTVVEPAHARALVHAERVPGTPRGVGEQHRLTREDGEVVLLEVTAHEPGRRAAVRTVDGIPPELAPVSTYEVEPVPGGCLLTVGTAWPALDGRDRLALRRHEGDHRWALRTLLEDVAAATAARVGTGPVQPEERTRPRG